MLAEVVTVPEKNSFVHNGILKESNVAFIFRDNRRFPSKFFHQYLQLLEVCACVRECMCLSMCVCVCVCDSIVSMSMYVQNKFTNH